MNIESIILLGTSLLAAIKAYFEWKKAKAESKRADDTEDMLKHTIKSVEVAKKKMDSRTKMMFSEDMRKYIEDSDADTGTIHSVVKERLPYYPHHVRFGLHGRAIIVRLHVQ